MKKNDKVPKTDKSDFEQEIIVLLREIHHKLRLLLKDMEKNRNGTVLFAASTVCLHS